MIALKKSLYGGNENNGASIIWMKHPYSGIHWQCGRNCNVSYICKLIGLWNFVEGIAAYRCANSVQVISSIIKLIPELEVEFCNCLNIKIWIMKILVVYYNKICPPEIFCMSICSIKLHKSSGGFLMIYIPGGFWSTLCTELANFPVDNNHNIR